MTELDDRWVLPLSGFTAQRCGVDHAFILVLMGSEGHSPPTFTLRIASPFSLERPSFTPLRLDPETDDKSRLAPALQLFGRSIRQSVAFKDGRLELFFDDGTRLVAPPDVEYEAWELSGDRGELVVSCPGGDLAVWRGREPVDAPGKDEGSRPEVPQVIEFDDYWFLPLRKRTVTRCLVDTDAFGLQFGDTFTEEPHVVFNLHVEGPFRLRDATGTEHYLVPPEGVTPALRLPGATVSKAFGYKDGRLRLCFVEGGEVLIVDTGEGQKWSLVGGGMARGIQVRSTPSATPRVHVNDVP